MRNDLEIAGKRFEKKAFTQSYEFVRDVCDRDGNVELNGIMYPKNQIIVMFDMLGNYPVWYFFVEV